MKSMMKAFLAVVWGALSMVSCLDEAMEMTPVVPEGVASYTAYVDGNSTKAELDGNVSMWKGDEWIQVVGRNGNYWFNANVPNPSASAVFTYNGDNGKFNENDVMAVYPAGSVNYGKDFENMILTNVTVPTEQTPAVDSYDPNAAVAVAYTTGSTLNFKNAVSLLKFKMGSDGVKNVTVWGDIPEGQRAAANNTLYLTPNSNWVQGNARFAAYFWNNSGNTWVDMTLVAGKTDFYQCTAPSGYPNVIFCRMNPGTTGNDWANKWDQTVDLTVPTDGKNHFTVSDGAWNNASGSWGTYHAVSRNGISGTGTVSYNNGNPVITGASNNYVSMTGTFVKGKTYYIAIAPVVFENGFTVEFSNDGNYNKYEVKSTSKRVEFKRNTIYDLGTLISGNETGFFTEPAIPDADKSCTIFYRPASSDNLYGSSEDLYVHIWLKDINGVDVDGCGSTWGDNDEKYKLSKVGTNLWSITLSPTVREWFGAGEIPLQTIGIIARNAAADVQTGDNFITVEDNRYGIETPLPEGMHHGINYNADGTVTLVLYDRDTNGKGKGYCYLLSELSNWERTSDYAMHRDDEHGVWWITLTDLDPDKEYKFQYSFGATSFDDQRTFDPYTEILYDTDNDKWIKDDVYPGLWKDYGSYYDGRAWGRISAFQINRPEYAWKVADYQIEDENDLVIYELLLRDFTDNSYGEGSIKAAMKYLDYLDDLGVNAIELMPVQEFDGNDSWGYGTHAYFAMDKVYGTRDDYKAFIDACHQRGMAVILDVVYNHATGEHPYAKLYWDGDKTAANNPWFNVEATHPYNVYHQWDHSNPMFREYLKQNLEYLIKEYKVDGFRFDLSKGFMGNNYNVDSYNSERVGYLKEYRKHIKSVDPNAVMICEHFVWDENYELGKAGIKVWQNMNHSFKESAMGWMSNASFEGLADNNLPFGTLVGYMESHDEERTMAAAEQFGDTRIKNSYELRLDRAGINAAFFLLMPGPKMIWQFGEIGYDYPIEHNGRTGKKPFVTDEYLANQHRKDLYDTYAMILEFRGNNPRFFDMDANFSWAVGSNNTIERHIYGEVDGKRFALFGNFGAGTQNISVTLPAGGTWYQYDNGAEWNGQSHSTQMAEGQFFLLVNDKSLCRK